VNGRITQWVVEECGEVPEEEADTDYDTVHALDGNDNCKASFTRSCFRPAGTFQLSPDKVAEHRKA
jgi:hypothetical protein